MPIALPANAQELLAEIARASLTRSFQQGFSEEPPDYVMNDQQQIRNAGREWLDHYAPEVTLLARVAQQALNYLETQDRQAAIAGFTSSVITQSALDGFLRANPYLTELIADAVQGAIPFINVLNLFVQLQETK